LESSYPDDLIALTLS